ASVQTCTFMYPKSYFYCVCNLLGGSVYLCEWSFLAGWIHPFLPSCVRDPVYADAGSFAFQSLQAGFPVRTSISWRGHQLWAEYLTDCASPCGERLHRACRTVASQDQDGEAGRGAIVMPFVWGG